MECQACAAYEEAVMAGQEPGEPCEHYEMTPTFRDWLVESMRKEVMSQVSFSGLNRMAMLKGRTPSEEE